MGLRERRVHLRPRLQAAWELIGRAHTVADIGCDHGRLGIALLQSGMAERVISTDISALSLEKARRLAEYTGVAARMEFRAGDGLNVLGPGEAQVISICGMGGMLIKDMLEAACEPLCGAGHAVLQPMRGASELRAYLFTHGYRIERDAIALDAGRYYQVFSVRTGQDVLPPGWPEGCFMVGHHAWGDPLFLPLVHLLLAQCEKRLITATNTRGEEELLRKKDWMERILKLL